MLSSDYNHHTKELQVALGPDCRVTANSGITDNCGSRHILGVWDSWSGPIYGTVKQDGLSLIPLSIYFVKGRAKLKIGLCKGKKLYDKRAVAAKKDAQRDIERSLSIRNS